uniref:Uncharacterized protein n=1 Tax=Arundo donax TaxID=35708 RepID=A0A0A9AHW3_ARUDO
MEVLGSTFLVTGDSSELAAADELAASEEFAPAPAASASGLSLRADVHAGLEDLEEGACSTPTREERGGDEEDDQGRRPRRGLASRGRR